MPMIKLSLLQMTSTWSLGQIAAVCAVLGLICVVLNLTGADTDGDGDSGDSGD